MKFFIDTANVEDIKKANDMGVICGVTTNPSLIAKEGRDFNEVIKEIASIVDGPISGEVKATTTKRGMPMSQNSLQNDLIVLYEKTREKVRGFQKKTYQSDMGILKEENQTLLECVKETIEKSEKCMQEVAGYVPEYASEMLSQIDSKRKREAAVIDHNMAMVAFFVPLMGEIQSTQTKIFTEKIVEIWNQKVPGSKIGHSDAASIENGFKKGVFCYITTAVCKSLNKPDDCYELNLLREYRDQYLMGTKDGEILVKEYYNIAPTIVKRIDRSPDASEIYADIWEKYLKPCVRLIEAGEQEECRELYTKMVRSLEKKYLYSVGGEKNE